MLPAADAIRSLEETTFASWPDLRHERLDGWLLRFADGHTKRANSVNVLQGEPQGLEARIDAAEARYRTTGLSPIFRITPLAEAELDTCLERRGYGLVEPSLVKTAPVPPSLGRHREVALWPRPEGAWLDGYVTAAGLGEASALTLAAMLVRIDGVPAYAAVIEEGRPLAFGMAVAHRGRVGFFDVLTLPYARRRGLSRRLMESLIAWARDDQGVEAMWIQVVAANTPARTFYRSLGFATRYGYHYRVAP